MAVLEGAGEAAVVVLAHRCRCLPLACLAARVLGPLVAEPVGVGRRPAVVQVAVGPSSWFWLWCC